MQGYNDTSVYVGALPLSRQSSAEVMDAWCKDTLRKADAVCFDVDSTLIQEEGVDKLAEFCGESSRVEEWQVEIL